MKIEFKQMSKNPKDIKVILDDKDITANVRSFKFNANADNISSVILELYPDSVEIESNDFKITTDDFTVNDLLNAIMNEGAEYAKKKIKRELFEKL